MAATGRPGAAPGALLPLVAIALLAVGALGVLGGVIGFAFAGSVPPVVRYANVSGAVVELALGLALRGNRPGGLRAAWSFALSLEATLSLINLIALPQMAHASVIGGVSIAFAVARGGLAIVLAMAKDEV